VIQLSNDTFIINESERRNARDSATIAAKCCDGQCPRAEVGRETLDDFQTEEEKRESNT
jgi:hypothetical protein